MCIRDRWYQRRVHGGIEVFSAINQGRNLLISTMFDLSVLSNVIGWIYFFAWSSSFYGQIYENWKLKSVEGFSLDYHVLNITGYIFYTTYSTVGYFGGPSHGVKGVTEQDLAFVYHALFAVTVLSVQILIYPHGKNRVSTFTKVILPIFWSIALSYSFLYYVLGLPVESNFLKPVPCLGYIKLTITLIKYIPPVYWNFKRKSTKGWSIINILLDVVGGCFSVLQIIIQLIMDGNLSYFTQDLNSVKFLLGIITLFFDSLFILQHYVVYPQPKYEQAQLMSDESSAVSAKA
eukprot:TRINITY_DN3663_c0_g1_i13.p1 TRINITY_DN3663_c0_g1~~TRINITY_DN3663_c0_g1_i13.p1  ORF type:complete len:318 (-),score=62.95 TRINITY_DN3663_c0_g1_i13:155-1024(-)